MDENSHNNSPVHNSTVGLRHRFVEPSPPAAVPKLPKPAPVAEVKEDKSTLRKQETAASSDRDVVRATGSMAVATLLSRITGFIRNVLIGSSLGTAVASAFTTANQLPNLITEIVLGAVLTSLVVPVLVRAEKEDADRGEAFIRRLFTLAVTLLGGITIVSVVLAPLLTEMMLPEDGEVNTAQATNFAYLLLPQIFFYGLFALFQAVLNTKNVFGPAAWAPVVNNIISIAVLVAYQVVPGHLAAGDAAAVTDPHILLLALGTTTGVLVQCAMLLPYIKKAGINLKPLWGLDDRLKQFGTMAVAIIAYVAVSQAGYVITSRVAAMADEGAPFTYQQAWLLLQVPYGVIGVTLLTAIMPRLSRNAADGDDKAVVRDLTLGTKLTFIALIPIVIFMTAFGIPIARGLFQYNQFSAEDAELLGLTLSFSAFTLIPYALVLLHLRVFYAREEAWVPTYIIAGTIITKVVLTLMAPLVATSPERVVILLGAANGFGFIAGAVIGAFLLRRKLGELGGAEVMSTTLWATGAAVVGLLPATALMWIINWLAPGAIPSWLYLVKIALMGGMFVLATGLVLARSGLPEVINVGRALQRIPGMNRIIKVSPAQGIEVEEPEMAEIQPIFGLDAFNSSPVPAPMSAGIVRGPRLVPGAPVSDGRFRLLRDCGCVPGARFWQAREQATGRLVALTFVDTTSRAPLAPAPPAEAARRAAHVARNTRKLAALGLETVPTNVDILSYRSGCLVVADWVEGSDLASVAAADNLDPHAVALAVAPLVDSTITAHEHGLVMGIDHRSRIRISTEGKAMLAFPAVLIDATSDTDRTSISKALTLLTDSTNPTPKVLTDLSAEDVPLADISAGLHEYAPSNLTPVEAEVAAEALPVAGEEEHPVVPTETAGFGSRSYSRSTIAIIGIGTTVFVIAMAFLTAWLTSVLAPDSPASPVSSNSVSELSRPTASKRPPIMLDMHTAVEIPTGRVVTDSLSPDLSTSWTTTQANTGLLITASKAAELRDVLLTHAGSSGGEVTIYGLNAADLSSTQLADGEVTGFNELADATLQTNSTNIDLKPLATTYDAVIVWVTALPADAQLSINDAQLTGVVPSQTLVTN
ncbi:MAG: murein biosynthesis integral membrane protein MurJ [Corynebacterium sp.]|nr:murein biosynthesis integral membrane protein MurJ [Corynebacterium sp.]